MAVSAWHARSGFGSNTKELTGAVSDLRSLTKIEAPVVAVVPTANSTMQPARLPLQLKIIAAVASIRCWAKMARPSVSSAERREQKRPRQFRTRAKQARRRRDHEFGFDYRNEAGAGAAGGLGFGLLSFCGATIRPGFEIVAEAVGLQPKMKDVTW